MKKIFFEFFAALGVSPSERIAFGTYEEENSPFVQPEQFYGTVSDETYERLAARNEKFAGIYWMVNHPDGWGFKNQNVKKIRGVFVDLDGEPLEPVLESKVEPNIIVETSPGKYHVYWWLEDCPLEQFTPIQCALINKFDSDEKIKDLRRVMRVPGFKHCKNILDNVSPYLITNVQYLSQIRHTTAHFVDAMQLDLAASEPPQKLSYSLKSKPSTYVSAATEADGYATREEVIEAMRFFNPDDREEWINVGIMLKSGGDYFDLWNSWSAQSPKYKEGEPQRKWNGFQPKVATLAPLFSQARARGYQTPAGVVRGEALPEETIQALLKKAKHVHAVKQAERPSLVFPPDLAAEAPGLVGRIAKWITDSAVKPQPTLSLVMALSLVGALKGHRVQTDSGLRTNLYCLGLAKSGTGKNHPLAAAPALLAATGQDLLQGGIPASDSALIRTLYDNGGRRFIAWDEFGQELQAMTNERAQTHKRAVLRCLMELFTSASSVYYGSEKANSDGRNPTKIIDQPCLSIAAMSTPSEFYAGLSSSYAASGFLPRWLVFEVEKKRVKKRKSTHSLLYRFPVGLYHEILQICEMPTNASGEGNLAAMAIKPAVIPFSPKATELLEQAEDYFYEREESCEERMGALWTRGVELASKVALTVTDGPTIGETEVRWALSTVAHCLSGLVAAVEERMGDTKAERDYKFVLELVRSNPGIKRWQLNRKCRSLEPKRLELILATLVEAKEIKACEEPAKNGGRNVTTFLPLMSEYIP